MHRISVHCAICAGCSFGGKLVSYHHCKLCTAAELHNLTHYLLCCTKTASYRTSSTAHRLALIDYISFIIASRLVFHMIGDIKVFFTIIPIMEWQWNSPSGMYITLFVCLSFHFHPFISPLSFQNSDSPLYKAAWQILLQGAPDSFASHYEACLAHALSRKSACFLEMNEYMYE